MNKTFCIFVTQTEFANESVSIEEKENWQNAGAIQDQISNYFGKRKDISILDICCGNNEVKSGYDPTGSFYKDVVARQLSLHGWQVTGIDKNHQSGFESDTLKIFNNIDITKNDWQMFLEDTYNVLIFLRSWDTPEILLYFQKLWNIGNLNLLSIELAKHFIPQFSTKLESGGLFFTTEVCNLGLFISQKEILLAQSKISSIFAKSGLRLLSKRSGLECWEKFF